MRISSGILKGLSIQPPQGIRPTQDKVKNAVFNILGNDLGGIKFLELYAGSGLVGFEAASRGAKEVVLVEKDYACCQAIEQNILKVEKRLKDKTVYLMRQDVVRAIENFSAEKQKFDIIFADPPYTKSASNVEELGAKKILQTLGRYDIITEPGSVIIQAHRREILEKNYGSLSLIRLYKYGDTVLLLYQKS